METMNEWKLSGSLGQVNLKERNFWKYLTEEFLEWEEGQIIQGAYDFHLRSTC